MDKIINIPIVPMLPPLKKYQSEALLFLQNKKEAALFMEQGTGKSRVILEEIKHDFFQSLIVCPKQLIPTWSDQIKTWTGHTINIVKKQNDLIPHCHVINLISVDFFSRKKDLSKTIDFLKRKNSYFIVDESSTIKNIKSARTKTLIKLGALCKGKKRILNGTPFTQTPIDIYSQMCFLNDQIFEQKSFWAFQNYYGVVIFHHLTPFTGFHEVIDYKNMEEMMNRVKPNCFFMKKEDAGLELPDKIHQKIPMTLEGDQKTIYKKLRDECLLDITNSDNSVLVPHALAKLGKLHQILSGFVNTGEEVQYSNTNTKLNTLMELIDFNPGKKILIWVNYVKEAELIKNSLEKKNIRVKAIYGSTSIEEIKEYSHLDLFQEPVDVLILTLKRSKGLNDLTNTDVVFFFGNSYSVAERMQAEDRCHRIGLKHNVLYYDLIFQNTVDEKLYNLLIDRKEFNNTLLEWLT